MISVLAIFTATYVMLLNTFLGWFILSMVVLNSLILFVKFAWAFIDDRDFDDVYMYAHFSFIVSISSSRSWDSDDWIGCILGTNALVALAALVFSFYWPVIIPGILIAYSLKGARFARRTQKAVDEHKHDNKGKVTY